MPALSISACARALAAGTVSAAGLADAALDRITALDGSIRSFTAVTPERARAQALAVDTARAGGEALGPLAGVPYAVKNLFDIEGVTTLAGARLLEGNPPATADATVIQRLSQAGAVLVGALNMDAYAYGFTTENTHYGTTRNPSDTTRVAGGSSGGSAAAVAAGFVSFALGTDTNGSIRVPSSFCGVFGLKPTFGRLTRAGAYPFATSLDHVGPFAGSAEDLAFVYDVLQGPDARDPRCTRRPVALTVPGIDAGIRGLRIAVLGGYFEQWADAHARAAAAHAASALGATDVVTLPEAERARAAAFVITASESGAFYLDRLRERAEEFEPLSRERLIAGAMLP
ncbi:MAG: Asp-tRNA(Asn)/Glu-tRNA(Gln) amidotransferase GatCAB subunit, partial [Betaproteobacteria bacterium]|nr:Asp-tRNA(Asn)/Glu-tRNA(Gln) amidotransferase GatCAB subunit [Betaproteobacteria bacterium]